MLEFKLKVVHLCLGTSAANFIPLLFMPLISKLFSPAEYGEFSGWVALLSIVAPVSCLKMEGLLATIKSKKMIESITKLCIFLPVVSCCVFTLFLKILDVCAIYSLDSNYKSYTFFFCGSLIFSVNYLTTILMAKNFDLNGILHSKIFGNILTSLVQLGSGILSFPFGLIAGELAGKGLSVFFRFKQILHKIGSWNIFISLRFLKKNYQHSMYMTFSSLVDSLNLQTPLLLIQYLGGNSLAGEFSMASRLSQIPIIFLGSSVSLLLNPFYAHHAKNATASKLKIVLKTSIYLALFALVFLFIVWNLNQQVLSVFFGKNWEALIDTLKPVSIFYCSSFIVSPLTSLVVHQKKQGQFLKLSLLKFFLNIAALFVGFKIFNPQTSLWLLCFSGFLGYFLIYIYLIKISCNEGKR